jgi:hypothetical protein
MSVSRKKKTVTVLAAERRRLWDEFGSKIVDDEAVDAPIWKRVMAVEAKLLKSDFENRTAQRVWWQILYDNDETPSDWDNFKVALFMRMKKFA